MSVQIACNVTVSEFVDTPFTTMREWLSPTFIITSGADYNISGDTLNIKQLRSRDNGKLITCASKIIPQSDNVLQSSSVNTNITLRVQGMCAPY